MERATGLEPASGIPRMEGHSREPCRTSHLTRLRRRWRQRVLSLVGKSFSRTGKPVNKKWSGRRGSNPLPASHEWKAIRGSPAEPLISRAFGAGGGSGSSLSSENPSPARENRLIKNGAGDGARTRYLHLGKVALYQMSYARKWCLRSESNQRHADFQSAALPTELQRHMGHLRARMENGDPERARTVDLQRDRLAF